MSEQINKAFLTNVAGIQRKALIQGAVKLPLQFFQTPVILRGFDLVKMALISTGAGAAKRKSGHRPFYGICLL